MLPCSASRGFHQIWFALYCCRPRRFVVVRTMMSGSPSCVFSPPRPLVATTHQGHGCRTKTAHEHRAVVWLLHRVVRRLLPVQRRRFLLPYGEMGRGLDTAVGLAGNTRTQHEAMHPCAPSQVLPLHAAAIALRPPTEARLPWFGHFFCSSITCRPYRLHCTRSRNLRPTANCQYHVRRHTSTQLLYISYVPSTPDMPMIASPETFIAATLGLPVSTHCCKHQAEGSSVCFCFIAPNVGTRRINCRILFLFDRRACFCGITTYYLIVCLKVTDRDVHTTRRALCSPGGNRSRRPVCTFVILQQ